MKKVLFASTALVASAGIAAAEVSISGFAEIGVVGGDGMETQFHTDIDATFTMSGETDGGLAFGASIDLDESDGDGVDTACGDTSADGSDAFEAACQGGETIFISGAFGTLTMGDTDGAFDWALTEAIIGSAIADDHEHAGYNGNSGLDGTYDGQVARYDYSFGDFAVAISGEIDDDGDGDGVTGDEVLGIGVKYSADLGGVDLAFGAGYQTNGTNDIAGASISASFGGGFQAIVNYSDLDGAGGNDSHMGIALGYTMDALTVAVNYGQFDLVGGGENDGYGLVVNYDLGGGAKLQAGYGSSDRAGTSTDSYSFGLAMSF